MLEREEIGDEMRMRKCIDRAPVPQVDFLLEEPKRQSGTLAGGKRRGNGAKGLPNGYRAFQTIATGNRKSLEKVSYIRFHVFYIVTFSSF